MTRCLECHKPLGDRWASGRRVDSRAQRDRRTTCSRACNIRRQKRRFRLPGTPPKRVSA